MWLMGNLVTWCYNCFWRRIIKIGAFRQKAVISLCVPTMCLQSKRILQWPGQKDSPNASCSHCGMKTDTDAAAKHIRFSFHSRSLLSGSPTYFPILNNLASSKRATLYDMDLIGLGTTCCGLWKCILNLRKHLKCMHVKTSFSRSKCLNI